MSDMDEWRDKQLREQESKERQAKIELETAKVSGEVELKKLRITTEASQLQDKIVHGPINAAKVISGKAMLIHLVWATAVVKVAHIAFVLCPGWK